MSRSPRILPAGYPVHLVHRGNNRGDIFLCQSDVHFMRYCLEQGGVGNGVALHSYVFMSNHMHLLLTAGDDTGISRLMQSAARRYVGYFNKKYERTGTLWEGRFFAAVVTTDHYLVACHRYIDLNPVRAGVVATPENYGWSSHRHHAYGTTDPLITPHPTIVALAGEAEGRRFAYRKLFRTQMAASEIDAIRKATRGQRALGEGWSPGKPGRPRKKMVSDTNYCGQGTARSCAPG